MAGRGRGGGMAIAVLPLMLTLLRKRPILAIILMGLGVAGYIVIIRSSSPVNEAVTSLMFGTGLEMEERIYDEAEVFEPLADNVKNPLPERVSLEKYCPPREIPMTRKYMWPWSWRSSSSREQFGL